MTEPLPPLRPWRRRMHDPLFVLFGVLTTICLVTLAVWGYTLYRIRVELNLVRIELAAYLKERAIKDEAWRAEFDTIYRTLYAPPTDIATATRRPSTVELWQQNRDAALQKRLRELEQWRYRMDR